MSHLIINNHFYCLKKKEYIGCYGDSDLRDMTYLQEYDPYLTIDSCRSLCYDKGFMYSGLQNG